LDKFEVEHKDFKDLLDDWFIQKEISFKESKRYITTLYLKIPYKILNTMIYKLYDEETSLHFRMEWYLMAYRLVMSF
jgi:hypothetical protein